MLKSVNDARRHPIAGSNGQIMVFLGNTCAGFSAEML
jgi:hypothetical protein